MPEGASGGPRMRRDPVRRGATRKTESWERTRVRRAPVRASGDDLRHVPRRARPEMLAIFDFVPLVVH
jgi:hypothetical protein